ncbi:hypothetical protein JCM18237_20980 [Halorubrum luteum]
MPRENYQKGLDERCRLAAEQVVRELVADQNAETSTAGGTELAAALDEVSRALLTVRDLERVGDHAVNIAARSLYMIESDDELIY